MYLWQLRSRVTHLTDCVTLAVCVLSSRDKFVFVKVMIIIYGHFNLHTNPLAISYEHHYQSILTPSSIQS